MNEAIFKRLRQFARVFPFNRKQPAEEPSDSGDENMSVVTQYACDVCQSGIQEGSNRYNCGECVASYDLCSSCYDSGEGTKHTESFGHLHELHLETRSFLSSCQQVRVDTLEGTFLNMFQFFAERPCIGVYIASRNRYEYLKYKEVGQLVANFGSALHCFISADHIPGVSPMLALCSVVRLEWYVTDYACGLLGVPTVGITASSDKATISFILAQTNATVVVCSLDLYPMFLSVAEEDCLSVKKIVLMDLNQDEIDLSVLARPTRSDLSVSLFSDMIVDGEKEPVDITQFKTDPEGIFTIAYTSGSTGNPKGCVFSRKLWLGHMNLPLVFLFGTKRIWFSFQPPSHMMERESFHLTLATGNKAGIYRGTMEHLFEDMRMVKPTVITSTPRFFAAIYNDFLQELYQEYVIYCKKCSAEHESTNDNNSTVKEISSDRNIPVPIASVQDFNLAKLPTEVKITIKQKFKDYFGGRERVIAVGGAAVSKELKRFLSFCFDAVITEGYGTTEAGGICNGDWSMGDVTIRLRDVPEMGYLTTDKPPRGEVCVKTKNMISGYYKNEEETDEKFQNGFFCTGDIGIMDTPGHVVVIDRKKNIFKLAQGEFVAPERVEGVYESLSNLIEQVYIYGNIYKSNVVAVVVPHQQALMQWREDQLRDHKHNQHEQKGERFEEICALPEVYELFMAELRALGQANGLQGWEIPAGIILEPNPFTVDNHLLTCTLKKSRPKLEKEFKDKLEELYESLEANSERSPFTKSIEQEIFSSFLFELSMRKCPLPPETVQKFPLPSSHDANFTLSLSQMGGDSLTAMRLSNLFRSYLFKEVPAVTILKEPLSVVLQILASSLTAQIPLHCSEPSMVDWNEETDISFLRDMPFACGLPTQKLHGREVAVLLTGATGFLGQFLLWEILNHKNVVKVFCLTRSSSDVPSINRIFSVINTLSKEMPHENHDQEKMMQKLTVLESDLSKPRLGLSDEDYVTIKTGVDIVIHNGAQVNHILSYNDLKETNVNGTKEILKLCRDSSPKVLHYVSTIGVFAVMPWETVTEDSIPEKDKLRMLSGYSQSKWVCEEMITKAVNEGLLSSDCSISRPGLIGAHSVTGRLNENDWFFVLVKGIKYLATYPTGGSWDKGTTNIIPVDVVTRSIVALCLEFTSKEDKQSVLPIYHLVNTTKEGCVSMNDIIRSLEKNYNEQLKPLGQNDFRSLLAEKANKENIPPIIIRLYLLTQNGSPLASYTSQFMNTKTQQKLESMGINLNVSLPRYADHYVQFLCKNET